jgi:ATP-dependent DNA helicase RecQ
MSTALEILGTVFGYHAFRGQQAAIIDRVVAGGDALVIMPKRGFPMAHRGNAGLGYSLL